MARILTKENEKLTRRNWNMPRNPEKRGKLETL
jgi:hypothetical protein